MKEVQMARSRASSMGGAQDQALCDIARFPLLRWRHGACHASPANAVQTSPATTYGGTAFYLAIAPLPTARPLPTHAYGQSWTAFPRTRTHDQPCLANLVR